MNMGMHGLRSGDRQTAPRVLFDRTFRGRCADIKVPLPVNQFSLIKVIGQDVVLPAGVANISVELYNSANVRGGRALIFTGLTLFGPLSFNVEFVVGARITASSWFMFDPAAGEAAGTTASTALEAGAPALSRLEIPVNISSGRIAVYGMLA